MKKLIWQLPTVEQKLTEDKITMRLNAMRENSKLVLDQEASGEMELTNYHNGNFTFTHSYKKYTPWWKTKIF